MTPDGQLAERPIIGIVSPNQVKPGGQIVITVDKAVKDASIIRYGATTHTVNNDQKRIPLQLTEIGNLQYRFQIPLEGYIALPGYWMLFVMDGNGVPSVAATIQIVVADNIEAN